MHSATYSTLDSKKSNNSRSFNPSDYYFSKNLSVTSLVNFYMMHALIDIDYYSQNNSRALLLLGKVLLPML